MNDKKWNEDGSRSTSSVFGYMGLFALGGLLFWKEKLLALIPTLHVDMRALLRHRVFFETT